MDGDLGYTYTGFAVSAGRSLDGWRLGMCGRIGHLIFAAALVGCSLDPMGTAELQPATGGGGGAAGKGGLGGSFSGSGGAAEGGGPGGTAGTAGMTSDGGVSGTGGVSGADGGTGGVGGTGGDAGEEVDATLPPCQDGLQNGSETDIDCGGADCPKCELGKFCGTGIDCETGSCVGVCTASNCADGTKNQDETDVDCGGSCPAKCAVGKQCQAALDCAESVCSTGSTPKVCLAPTCKDGVRNGGETDGDCGGPDCGPCDAGRICLISSDCKSKGCDSGYCLTVVDSLTKEILADLPSGYWPLDETSGVVAHDASGHGCDGGFQAGQVLLGNPGPAGTAVDFQGNGWIQSQCRMMDLTSGGEGTISAIVRMPDVLAVEVDLWPGASLPHVFSDIDYFRGASVGIFQGIPGVHFWSFFDGYNTDHVSLPAGPGEWTHVAWVMTSSELRGYVNGVAQTTVAHGPTASTLSPFSIGHHTPWTSACFPSMMQHVATFSTALPATRLQVYASIAGLYP